MKNSELEKLFSYPLFFSRPSRLLFQQPLLLLSFYYTVYYNGNENNILIAKRGTDYICGI